jgi:hypothetical protein
MLGLMRSIGLRAAAECHWRRNTERSLRRSIPTCRPARRPSRPTFDGSTAAATIRPPTMSNADGKPSATACWALITPSREQVSVAIASTDPMTWHQAASLARCRSLPSSSSCCGSPAAMSGCLPELSLVIPSTARLGKIFLFHIWNGSVSILSLSVAADPDLSSECCPRRSMAITRPFPCHCWADKAADLPCVSPLRRIRPSGIPCELDRHPQLGAHDVAIATARSPRCSGP